MKKEKDIKDNEIRIIGVSNNTHKRKRMVIMGVCSIILLGLVIAIYFISTNSITTNDDVSYFEPLSTVENDMNIGIDSLSREKLTELSFVEIVDTVINDIPLKIYIPHNAQPRLRLGKINKSDSSIIFATQAADIRRDNGKILGTFVLSGEPLAQGVSKKGYCAIIDGEIKIGVAENSSLFEEATEKKGYFFRQYPLVDKRKLVENEPKNKSIRRALCTRQREVFIVETQSNESFHDFAQSLVDLQVNDAVYLVGSTAFGWAIDKSGNRKEFGVENVNLPQNTSYLVWESR